MYESPEYQKVIYNLLLPQSSPAVQSMLQSDSVPEDYIIRMFPEVTDSKRVVNELIAPAIKKLSDHYSQLPAEEQASIFPFSQTKQGTHSISKAKNSGDVVLGYLSERRRLFIYSATHTYSYDWHVPASKKEQHLKDADNSAAKLHTAFSSAKDVIFNKSFTAVTPDEKHQLIAYLDTFFDQIADTFNLIPYYKIEAELGERDHRIRTFNQEIKLIMKLVKTANELPELNKN